MASYGYSALLLGQADELPAQTGHAGQFLSTDGTNVEWIAGAPGGITAVTSANTDIDVEVIAPGQVQLTLSKNLLLNALMVETELRSAVGYAVGDVDDIVYNICPTIAPPAGDQIIQYIDGVPGFIATPTGGGTGSITQINSENANLVITGATGPITSIELFSDLTGINSLYKNYATPLNMLPENAPTAGQILAVATNTTSTEWINPTVAGGVVIKGATNQINVVESPPQNFTLSFPNDVVFDPAGSVISANRYATNVPPTNGGSVSEISSSGLTTSIYIEDAPGVLIAVNTTEVNFNGITTPLISIGRTYTDGGAASVVYTFPQTLGTDGQVMAAPASGEQLVWITPSSTPGGLPTLTKNVVGQTLNAVPLTLNTYATDGTALSGETALAAAIRLNATSVVLDLNPNANANVIIGLDNSGTLTSNTYVIQFVVSPADGFPVSYWPAAYSGKVLAIFTNSISSDMIFTGSPVKIAINDFSACADYIGTDASVTFRFYRDSTTATSFQITATINIPKTWAATPGQDIGGVVYAYNQYKYGAQTVAATLGDSIQISTSSNPSAFTYNSVFNNAVKYIRFVQPQTAINPTDGTQMWLPGDTGLPAFAAAIL